MEINKFYGKILIIGNFEEAFLTKLANNHKIEHWDHLSNETKEGSKGSKRPIVNIKQLRKKYRKETFDFLIFDQANNQKYAKFIVRDSIYLVKNKVIIINYNKNIIKQFKRYQVKIKENKNLEIDVSKAKSNFIKDRYHLIQDYLEDIYNYISDFLSM